MTEVTIQSMAKVVLEHSSSIDGAIKTKMKSYGGIVEKYLNTYVSISRVTSEITDGFGGYIANVDSVYDKIKTFIHTQNNSPLTLIQGYTVIGTHKMYVAGTNNPLFVSEKNPLRDIQEDYFVGELDGTRRWRITSVKDHSKEGFLEIGLEILDEGGVTGVGSFTGTAPDTQGDMPVLETSVNWGNIFGTLSAQIDLKEALDAKANLVHTHDYNSLENLPDLSSLHTHANMAVLIELSDTGNTLLYKGNIIGVTDHDDLSSIGANSHAQIDNALSRLSTTSGINSGDQDLSPYQLKSQSQYQTGVIASGIVNVTTNNQVYAFVSGGTAYLPSATGSFFTCTIINESNGEIVTIIPFGSDTIKKEAIQELYEGDDVILRDIFTEKWA